MSKINKSERVCLDMKELMQNYSKEQIASICQEITKKLCSKSEELAQLFQALRKAYPEMFALMDFSVICAVTAAPFTTANIPFCSMLGTERGIAKGVMAINYNHREVVEGGDDSNSNNEETA